MGVVLRILNAVVVAVLALAYAVSFAAVIFTGALSSAVGIGIDAALIAVALVGGIIALRSSFRFALAGPDSNPTAVLALVAAAIVPSLSVRAAVPTMMTIVTLSTALTGVTLFVFGRVGAGRVIRYIPQPMIGGFNAAAGVLVAFGAIRSLATGAPAVAHVTVGIAFGIAIVVLAWRFGAAAMPVAFAAAILIANTALRIAHVPLDALRRDGWFFALPATAPMFPWNAAPLVDWHAIALAAPNILVVALVSAATLLLNESGLELLEGHDVDLDRELRVAGIANLVGSLFGSMTGFVSFTRSALSYSLGARTRSTGIFLAASALLIVVVGPQHLMGFVPTFATAGLLVAIGANVAIAWLVPNRDRESLGDFITVWLIVIAVVAKGFIAGIFVGLAAGCVTFVIRYAQIDAVKRRHTAATLHSRLLRSSREVQALVENGERIRIFELRGYIFFGIADRIYRELLACADAMQSPGWIVVDMASVTGMDSSAAGAFVKLLRRVPNDAAIEIVFSGMRPRVARLWTRTIPSDVRSLVFHDLDLAMEWCETALLRDLGTAAQAPDTVEMWLGEQIGKDVASVIRAHMRRIDLDTGDVLCVAGDPSDAMFVIESGRVAVISAGDEPHRIMSVGAHATIGELGLYRHAVRSATVVAEGPTVAYELSRDDLDVIESRDPIASTAFHAAIIRGLGDRMEYQNGLLATLLE